jgi:hypothetical protein
VKVEVSLNNGYDWISEDIDSYISPLFTKLEQTSFDARGGFMTNIYGSGFIDTTPYLSCVFKGNTNEYTTPGVFINSNFIQCKAPSGFNSGLNLLITYGDTLIDTGFTVKYEELPDIQALTPNLLNKPEAVTIVTQDNPAYTTGICEAFGNDFILNIVSSGSVCNLQTFNNKFSELEISYNNIDYSVNELIEYIVDIHIDSMSPLLVIYVNFRDPYQAVL